MPKHLIDTDRFSKWLLVQFNKYLYLGIYTFSNSFAERRVSISVCHKDWDTRNEIVAIRQWFIEMWIRIKVIKECLRSIDFNCYWANDDDDNNRKDYENVFYSSVQLNSFRRKIIVFSILNLFVRNADKFLTKIRFICRLLVFNFWIPNSKNQKFSSV